MQTVPLLLGFLLITALPVHAVKNAHGTLIVHTADFSFTADPCGDGYDDPEVCESAVTRTNKIRSAPVLIWLIAAFPEAIDPEVKAIYFGHDHNLPEYSHDQTGVCGPPGTIEAPNDGWPDEPATAGNAVVFGSPVAGERLFPFYWVMVYGFPSARYGTDLHPLYGCAAFIDDSTPQLWDTVEGFGFIGWNMPGHNDCPRPVKPGACCLATGECQLLLDVACEAADGEFQGEETVCDPNPCPQPTGACCFADGSCDVLTEPGCTDQEGDWQEQGAVCDPNPCRQPGACCFTDGSCEIRYNEYECSVENAEWLGHDLLCDPNPCPQRGACCGYAYIDGEYYYRCNWLVFSECRTWPGTYDWVEGEDCDPDPCRLPGACCFTDGSCVIFDAYHECRDAGGEWHELHDVCDPNPCPQPGACCYVVDAEHPTYHCVMRFESVCRDIPGWYDWIEDEVCDPYPCPLSPTKETTWGEIKATYR